MRYKIIDSFLSAKECSEVISLAKERLAPSETWSVENGRSELSDYRQSEQMFFAPQETDLIKEIEARMVNATKLPVQNGEGLQVVHYGVGGYYKPHWDFFDPSYGGNTAIIRRGGQRIVTVLVYLNTVEQGGETFFPRVDVKVIPVTGMACVWWNVLPDGNGMSIDLSTYHEARPVLAGEKWICTKWFRENTFR